MTADAFDMTVWEERGDCPCCLDAMDEDYGPEDTHTIRHETRTDCEWGPIDGSQPCANWPHETSRG